MRERGSSPQYSSHVMLGDGGGPLKATEDVACQWQRLLGVPGRNQHHCTPHRGQRILLFCDLCLRS
jgi:hypothetical protein